MNGIRMQVSVTERGSLVLYDEDTLRSFVFIGEGNNIEATRKRQDRLKELEQLRAFVRESQKVRA